MLGLEAIEWKNVLNVLRIKSSHCIIGLGVYKLLNLFLIHFYDLEILSFYSFLLSSCRWIIKEKKRGEAGIFFMTECKLRKSHG